MTAPPKPITRPMPTREDRVAEALRENLRKRKQQAQTRAVQIDDTKDA